MAYQVNFCETKEQLKHLAEVVTGKADGSPNGADIDTSTLAYAGLVRDTLPEVLSKLGWYSVGEWSTDPLISKDNQYVLYNGIRYVPLSTPYQVNSTANPDPEALVGTELKVITDVTNSDLTDAQNELLPPSSRIYPSDGFLQNGQVVDSGSTHLRVLVGGEPKIVAMSPVASGSVSGLTETGATIGSEYVAFSNVNDQNGNLSMVKYFGLSHDYEDVASNTQKLNELIQIGKQFNTSINLDKPNTYIKIGALSDFDAVDIFTTVRCFLQSFSTLTLYTIRDASESRDGLVEIPFTHRFNDVSLVKSGGVVTSSLNFDSEAIKDSGLATYYVIGDRPATTTVDGLSIAGGFAKLSHALSQADCGEVILTEREYHRLDSALINQSINKKIIIRSINPNGSTLSSKEDPALLSWSAYNSIWSATRSNVGRVLDKSYSKELKNSKGQSTIKYKELDKKSSIAEVEAAPNSWFLDVDNTLYVRTIDDREPDSDIAVLLNVDLNFSATDPNAYLLFDNIRTEGFQTGLLLNGSEIGRFVGRNCRFEYTCKDTARGAFSAEGWDTYLEYCSASFTAQDGFSYHPRTGTTVGCSSYEIGCFSFETGNYTFGASFPQHNGSTSHVHCTIVRANGEYRSSKGPVVVDVGDGNRALNINLYSSGSNIKIPGNGDPRPFENTSGSKGYYIGCSGSGGGILTDDASFTDSEVFLNTTYVDGLLTGNSRKFLQW